MAFGNSTERLRQDFEAQFERAGDRYLFRRNQRGEPIPITAQEREDFIRQYARRIRFIIVGMTAGLLLFMGVVIWWAVSAGAELPDIAIYAGLLAITVVAISAMYWARAAPARALQGRSSIGRERSKEEMRAIYFRKISYGQLAGAAVLGVVVAASKSSSEDIFSGWHQIWLVLGAGLVILAAVQALRKWIFENQ